MHSFADWLDAMRFRWKLIALITACFVGLALVYLIITPRSYSATSALLLDNQGPNPLGEENSGGDDARSAIATQADLIRSPGVAARAAAIAGIAQDRNTVNGWRAATGGKVPYDGWLRQQMLSALTVEPGKDTNVLLVQAKARNPEQAAKIANGFAKASVESQFRLRTEPAKAYAAWLSNRVEASRVKVVEAQQALSAFVRATGISDGNLSSEGSQMSDVATQLATAEARAAATRQSGFADTQGRGDAERSSTIQGLRQSVAEKSGKLADLQAMFGPEYPDVKRTRAELSTLQSQLNTEIASATNAFSSARNAEAAAERAAASASEARLRSLAAQQRSRVDAMGANLAQYDRLKNEFGAAQRDYNDVSQRLSKMRLQGNVPLTDVQVLDLATPPLSPNWPNPGLVLMLAITLGALLGAIAAVIMEAMNPRVRSWGSIERLLGVPVVGRIALPRMAGTGLTHAGGTGPLLLDGRGA